MLSLHTTTTTKIYTFPYTTLFRSETTAPCWAASTTPGWLWNSGTGGPRGSPRRAMPNRSEEHTSELQSHHDLVCRLLLEKKNSLFTCTALKMNENVTVIHSNETCS